MKRSLSDQRGVEASNLRCFSNNTVATSAMPMGIPECPEFAVATASRVRARMAVCFGPVSWMGDTKSCQIHKKRPLNSIC